MRRFVSLAVILFFAIPFGVSGCKKALVAQFCDAGDSGPTVGQVASIELAPTLATTGLSLSYGQIGQSLSASALDCKGSSVSVTKYTYATSNMAIADINPSTGQVCAGSWNRNTGGGVADFTTCFPFTGTSLPATTTTASSLSAPTAPSLTTGSTTTLSLGTVNDTVSGTLSLTLQTVTTTGTTLATAHDIVVAPRTSLTALAAQIDADTTYQGQGITATFSTSKNVLTISGPVSTATTSSTLVTTGSPATTNPTVAAVPGTSLTDTTPGSLAYLTATAQGVVSNAIPVYIHPIVTGIVLTAPESLTSCNANDPTSDCCPSGTFTTTYTPTPASYNTAACTSQGFTSQMAAKVYQNGTTNASDNITCQIGHLTFSPATSSIVSIDENGVATAGQPGSSIVTASTSNSSTASSAGFFSTCPPASIALAANGQSSNAFNLALNNSIALTVTALDTNGNPLTGLDLVYSSTTPTTLPATSSSITPAFPGVATVTAACQPPTCNPSPFSQLGFLNNGKPVTSSGLTVTTTGTGSTVLYGASTSSQYIFPMDFSTNLASSLIKLPYVPNSMVLTQDGSTLYLGSTTGLMTVLTASNTASAANTAVPGTVLSVSPDGSTVVVTDTVRKTVSLYSTSSSGISTSTGGVGTRAVWSPDSTMVYITLEGPGGGLLTHSNANNWQITTSSVYADAVVTVPGIGAYFAGQASAGSTLTDGRSYCSATTINTAATNTAPASVTNSFAPLVDTNAAVNDRLAATTDGKHILGATVYGTPALNDIDVTLPTQTTSSGATTIAECPPATQGGTPLPTLGYFTSTPMTPKPLSGITPAAIDGVVPDSSSALAFVTYSLASTATSGGQLLPYYIIPASGAGTVGYFTLGNGATTVSAPESGVFSTDNSTFYVGTGATCTDGNSVDNNIHILSITGTTIKETGILSPNLPLAGTSCSGPYAPVNMMAQRPKKSTT